MPSQASQFRSLCSLHFVLLGRRWRRHGVMFMTKYVLLALLVISFLLNVYFYLSASRWEEAWLEQFVTTSEVEDLLKASSPELSYDDVARILKGASPVDAGLELLSAGIDKKALKYGGTTFFFKDRAYAGSKADLPNH